MKTVRTNVVFPENLYMKLKKVAGPRKKNSFIVNAVDIVLKNRLFKHNFEKFYGCWDDDEHKNLNTLKDLKNYFNNIRSSERGIM